MKPNLVSTDTGTKQVKAPYERPKVTRTAFKRFFLNCGTGSVQGCTGQGMIHNHGHQCI